MDPGDPGVWDPGSRILGSGILGSWVKDPGSWDPGSRILGSGILGSRILGSRVMDPGSRDPGRMGRRPIRGSLDPSAIQTPPGDRRRDRVPRSRQLALPRHASPLGMPGTLPGYPEPRTRAPRGAAAYAAAPAVRGSADYRVGAGYHGVPRVPRVPWVHHGTTTVGVPMVHGGGPTRALPYLPYA